MEDNFNKKPEQTVQKTSKQESSAKMKKKKAKKAIITLSAIVVLFLGLQVYASVNGYGNVFFMIKNLITTGNPAGTQEIFSDKDITLSYKSIDLAEGVKIQANRLEVKDGKTKLYLSVKSQNGELLPLKYEVTTISNEGNETTATTKITGTRPENTESFDYEDILTLDYEVQENKTIVLIIKDTSEKELRTLEINLQTREITVKGEKEFEKISQIELRKYLDLFSVLNSDLSKDDALVYIATKFQNNYEKLINEEVYENAKNNLSSAEFTNAIIKEIYGENAKFEKINSQEQLELKNATAYGFSERYGYIALTEGSEIKNGHCLKIEDVNYENDIYTVKYIYLLATGYEEDNDKLEDLPQYETTIKLKRNENNQYSKYEIVSIEKGTEVKNKVSTDVNENVNEEEQNPTNYIDSINWKRYDATDEGLSFDYPADYALVKSPDRGIVAEMTGLAIGRDVETNNAVKSNLTIRLYCNTVVDGYEIRDILQRETGYTTKNGDKWYTNYIDGHNTPGTAGYQKIENYVNYEDIGKGRYLQRMIEFDVDNRNNYKITNIINKIIGSTKLTKLADQYTDNTSTNVDYEAKLFNKAKSITNSVSQNIDNYNWKETFIGGISTNFKYPKNFDIYTYEKSVHVSGGIEGINNENIYVGIDIERLPIGDLEVEEDLDRTVKSKDNNGWTDWKPVKKYDIWNPLNGILTGGGVRRTYARTKNGTAIFARFDFHTNKGLTTEHYNFIKNILENVSSTGV